MWEEAAVRERVAERESRNWLTHPTTFFPPSSPFQFDTSVSSPRCQNSQAAEENKSDEKKVCLAFLTPVLFLILAHKNKNLTSLFFFFKPV